MSKHWPGLIIFAGFLASLAGLAMMLAWGTPVGAYVSLALITIGLLGKALTD